MHRTPQTFSSFINYISSSTNHPQILHEQIFYYNFDIYLLTNYNLKSKFINNNLKHNSKEMQSTTQIPIKELLQISDIDMRKIFTHSEIIFIIKNQDPIIRTIFTQKNVEMLLTYLTRQYPLQNDNKHLCYMMPQMAMQILCCESHWISEVIFESEKQQEININLSQSVEIDAGQKKDQHKVELNSNSNSKGKKSHLLELLLGFLDYNQQHYFLASYFSKSAGSLTKRVFTPTHKYNQILCNKIFGQSNQKSKQKTTKIPYLLKTLNHLYSQSMNQLIIRWLTLKSKENNYQQIKQKFIQMILYLINLDQSSDLSLCQFQLELFGSQTFQIINFTQQSLQSIINLIMLLLKSPLQPPPERPQQVQHKNINLLINKNAQKQLYQMMCKQKYILQILKPIPNPRIQKLILMKKILHQYRTQKEQKLKIQEPYNDRYLGQVINQSMLVEGLGWVNQVLMVLSQGISYPYNIGDSMSEMQSVQSQSNDKNIQDLTTKPQINKKYLIAYLELLYQFHLLHEQLEQPLTFHYEQNQKHHILIILKFLSLKNNLIQNLLTKIITIVLKKLNCTDFATALLHHGISHVIDVEGIRQHVLQWAQIIMENQGEKGHVYENAQQEAKWDHMGEVVSAAQDIVIGKFRFRPANLDSFYSVEKAKDYYAKFLSQPIQIQYEQKISLKKIQSQNSKKEEIFQEINLQKKFSLPETSNKYKVDKIIEQNQQKKQKIQTQNKPEQKIEEKFININSNTNQADTKISQITETLPIDALGIDTIRQGYIFYDADKLLAQVEQSQ